MTLLRLSALVALSAAVPFLASCSSNLDIVSKDNIKLGVSACTKSKEFIVPPPSSTLIADAASKPKDKHSMPIYSFSERHRVVRTTAYTCSECDHLIYGSKNAAGTDLRYSDRVRSAAADWSFYPVGTVFRVKGMPYLYVVDDYGSALTGTGTIDFYKPSKTVMNQWGRRNVEISVVQWGSFKRSAEILSARTKFPHCAQMLANITRQRPDLAPVAYNKR